MFQKEPLRLGRKPQGEAAEQLLLTEETLRDGDAGDESIFPCLDCTDLSFVDHVEDHRRHQTAALSIDRKECLPCNVVEVHRLGFDAEPVCQLEEVDVAGKS